MTPRELARAVRARRRELEAEVRARLDAIPAVRAHRRRRRVRRAVLSAAALLLLLFVRCDCGEAPPALPASPDAGAVKAPEVAERPRPKPAVGPSPLWGTLPRQVRPDLGALSQGAPPWLDAFRLQVVARSPRLAECFTGSERPGALRWAAAVNPNAGTVSDHALEPVGEGRGLLGEQRACVLRVLASPSYQLGATSEGGLPARVSLVIEF